VDHNAILINWEFNWCWDKR